MKTKQPQDEHALNRQQRIKRRRACKHEWVPVCCLADPKHDGARHSGWRRYCAKCESYSR